mmetsp:Transcript_29580/g.71935  ORF Transcript_29580/g.71935 Transcript_29580/m.71935 type:complete len:504 (+) Transcript_29580:4618-6129(+)
MPALLVPKQHLSDARHVLRLPHHADARLSCEESAALDGPRQAQPDLIRLVVPSVDDADGAVHRDGRVHPLHLHRLQLVEVECVGERRLSIRRPVDEHLVHCLAHKAGSHVDHHAVLRVLAARAGADVPDEDSAGGDADVRLEAEGPHVVANQQSAPHRARGVVVVVEGRQAERDLRASSLVVDGEAREGALVLVHRGEDHEDDALKPRGEEGVAVVQPADADEHHRHLSELRRLAELATHEVRAERSGDVEVERLERGLAALLVLEQVLEEVRAPARGGGEGGADGVHDVEAGAELSVGRLCAGAHLAHVVPRLRRDDQLSARGLLLRLGQLLQRLARHDVLATELIAQVDAEHRARAEAEVKLQVHAFLGVPVVHLLDLLESARHRTPRQVLDPISARTGAPNGENSVAGKLDHVARVPMDDRDQLLEEAVDDLVEDLGALLVTLGDEAIGQLREARDVGEEHGGVEAVLVGLHAEMPPLIAIDHRGVAVEEVRRRRDRVAV